MMSRQTVTVSEPVPSWAEETYNIVSATFPAAPPEFRESLALTLLATKYVGITNAQVLDGITAIYATGIPEIE